jgi:murein DD-endopeptidase MepM/ murein hydrolase activator NlpD
LALLAGAALAGWAAPAQAVPAHGVWPLAGPVVRDFDPPDQPWLPGHRGLDIAGQAGDPVAAAADGIVQFAGLVAGTPVISIAHGDLVTTYQPVTAAAAAGQPVAAGNVIGWLEAGHCAEAACLHWGLKQGSDYLDPRGLLPPQTVRLLPLGAVEALRQEQLAWEAAHASTGLLRPLATPITSPFGYRISPITGTPELHDGTDFGAACGTPVRAAAGGVITQQYAGGGYGNRVFVDHGAVSGERLVTAYNHLSAFALSVGATVDQGDVIAYVGTTGMSTGCHLHFMVWANGALVDPMTRLP